MRIPAGRFVIEQSPVRGSHGAARDVVAQGAAGHSKARRIRLFRYEVRRWHGVTPDVAEVAATTVASNRVRAGGGVPAVRRLRRAR